VETNTVVPHGTSTLEVDTFTLARQADTGMEALEVAL